MKLFFVMIASLALALTACTTTRRPIRVNPDFSLQPSKITKFDGTVKFWVELPADHPLFLKKRDRPIFGKVEVVCTQTGVLKSIRLVVNYRTVYYCMVTNGHFNVAVAPNSIYYLEPKKWEAYFKDQLLPRIKEAVPWYQEFR